MPSEPERRESVWVIEQAPRSDDDPTMYFSGLEGAGTRWTISPNRAMWFDGRTHAETYCRSHLSDQRRVSVAEHVWLGVERNIVATAPSEPERAGTGAEPEMVPVAPDSPVFLAWQRYKQTNEFASCANWAMQRQHTIGSIWAAFEQGFRAASASAEPARRAEREIGDALVESDLWSEYEDESDQYAAALRRDDDLACDHYHGRLREIRREIIRATLAAAEPARGAEEIQELSPEHPARPLCEHLKTLSECGEGLVSIDGDAYWINADDRGALRTALALSAGPRACDDGALVWWAARALSVVAPRHAEWLRDLAARLGYGGGDEEQAERVAVPENPEKSGTGDSRETAALTERLARAEGALDKVLAWREAEGRDAEDHIYSDYDPCPGCEQITRTREEMNDALADYAARRAAGGGE